MTATASLPTARHPLRWPAALRGRFGVRTWLIALALASALPVLLFAGIALQQVAETDRNAKLEALQRRAEVTAKTVESYLLRLETTAVILANIAEQMADDLPGFHARARSLIKSRNVGDTVILADSSGQYLLNSRFPFGTPLGQVMDTEAFARLREVKAPVITNVLASPVSRTLLFAAQAPILKDDKVERVLILGVEPRSISYELLGRQLPPNWNAAVIDRDGTFVGRSRDPDKWVGQRASAGFLEARKRSPQGPYKSLSVDGVESAAYFVNLLATGWTVAVAVPAATLTRSVLDEVQLLIWLGLLSLLAALALAYVVSTRMANQVAVIRRSATTLGDGGTPFISRLGVREFDDVMTAVDSAHTLIANREAALKDSQANLHQWLVRRQILLDLALDLDRTDLTREEMGKIVYDKIKSLLNVDLCFNYIVNDETTRLELVYGHGIPAEFSEAAKYLDLNEAFCGTVAATYISFVVDKDGVATHPKGDLARALHIGAYCCHPLRAASGRALGTLALASTRRNRFDPDEIAFLQLVASALARVWERLTAEREIAENVMLLRTVTDHVSVGLVMLDGDRQIKYANPAFSWLLDLTAELAGRGLFDVLPPAYSNQLAAALERAYAGEIVSLEMHAMASPAGMAPAKGMRCLAVVMEPQLDSAGKVAAVVSVMLDVTESKRAEEHRELLMKEVNHRAKNLLAVVQSVAAQTAGEGRAEDFVARFSNRLSGLSASQDLLVRSEWRGVDAGDLVRSQLSHFAGLIGTRISVLGPPVWLKPSAAQALGMALHELTTNAAKYGALSVPLGSIKIKWQFVEAAGETQLRMRWSEHGGPPVVPPTRRGFGHNLIVAAVEHALDANVNLNFDPSGLIWQFDAPLEQLTVAKVAMVV